MSSGTAIQSTQPKSTSDSIASGGDIPPLAALENAISARRPTLGAFLRTNGDRPLLEYVAEQFVTNPSSVFLGRQEEFLATMHAQILPTLGKDSADAAVKQLRTSYAVYTADHQGPLCHSWFVHSHMATALAHREASNMNMIIALSCANVSMHTASFPRGLFFHAAANGSTTAERHILPFFSRKFIGYIVHHFHAFAADAITKLLALLEQKARDGEITAAVKTVLQQLVENIYNKKDVLEQKSYADQLTKTNYMLWKTLSAASSDSVSDMITLEQETIVERLLLDHHMEQKTSVHHMLFDSAYHELIQKHFDGIDGAFHKESHSGTFLFWAVPKGEKYRVKLWKEGDMLVSEDRSFSIRLTPEDIANGLREKLLVPSSLVDFMVLAFYYGVRCIGGPNQMDYLTAMKEAFIKLHEQMGDQENADLCRSVTTNSFSCDYALAFLQPADGSLTAATLVDMLLYGKDNIWKAVSQSATKLTVREALASELIQYYVDKYDEVERDPTLAAFSAQPIISAAVRAGKITPFSLS